MTLLRPIVLAATLGAASLRLASLASAQPVQPHDPAAAEALFLAGRDAVTRGDYAAACPKFAESNRVDPAAGTMINLADCEEHLGILAAAWDHWKEAIELLPQDDARRPIAQQRAAAADKRVPRLTIKLGQGAPPNTRVTRDDVDIGIASLSLALPENPGEHVVVVTAPGHKENRYPVKLVEGQSQELTVQAGEAEQPVAPAVPPPAPAPEKPSPPRDTRLLGYVIGGVGVAGIGVGSVTGILAIGKKSDLAGYCHPANVCTPQGGDIASAGRTLALVSTVSFLAGAAAVGVGVYFVLSSPRAGSARGTSTALAPLAYPGGAGVALARSF